MERSFTPDFKLKRLRDALDAGEADLAAGRVTVVSNDAELEALFERLVEDPAPTSADPPPA